MRTLDCQWPQLSWRVHPPPIPFLELELPADKLQRLQDLLRSWLSRASCTKQELKPLIGYLSHACYVVRAGKSFLRRLIELVPVARRAHHFVRLNASHRADLWWWEAFLAPLNHASFFRGIPSRPRFSFFSDASGSVGCGAIIWSPYWFKIKWQSQLFSQWLELSSDSITFNPYVVGTGNFRHRGVLSFKNS